MKRTLINIRTVLAEMELPDGQGQPRAFSLEYYKTDGSRGSKPAVQKGGQAGGAASGGGGKFRYQVKEKGTVQLVDCQHGRPFALKICLLARYNGQPILHG